jgi:hypothetical protein
LVHSLEIRCVPDSSSIVCDFDCAIQFDSYPRVIVACVSND